MAVGVAAPVQVLVVEDERIAALDLAETLIQLGYGVVDTVATGEEALVAARRHRPTIILMDIRLAGRLDGIETATRIRQESDVPVVFLTAHADVETVNRAKQSAPFGYLIKPFREPELRCAIELATHNHGVETERRERERQQASSLEHAYGAMESFSYSVAHDLRAPVRVIRSFGEALLEDHGQSLAPDGVAYVARMQLAAKRMETMIDDLLRLGRDVDGALQRGPVDLTATAACVVDALRAGAPDRAVEVALEPGMTVDADPGLIRIVLDNLIGNAWKFTADRADARIELVTERLADETVIAVRDNGAGFAADKAARLFGAFQRFHPTSQFAGNGIGLAIVHRIIRRHGGRIWADSQVGAGATFRFTL